MKLFKNSTIIKITSFLVILVVIALTISMPLSKFPTQVHAAETVTFTNFSLPVGSDAEGVTNGPDGNLWFTEGDANKIGKMTTSGIVTEYVIRVSPSFVRRYWIRNTHLTNSLLSL